MASVTISIPATTKVIGFLPQDNGDFVVEFVLLDGSGVFRGTKQFLVKSDGSGVVDLNGGAQIASSVAAAYINGFNNFKALTETLLSTAASAGKITPP